MIETSDASTDMLGGQEREIFQRDWSRQTHTHTHSPCSSAKKKKKGSHAVSERVVPERVSQVAAAALS